MFLLQLSQELLQYHTNFSAIPLAIPLVIMGAQLIFSGIKYAKAQKEKNTALDAINNYKRQQLKNVYEGTSYYNAEARASAMKEINDKFGTTVSAATQGGSRSMGAVVSAQEKANNAILKQAAFENEAYIQHQDRMAQGEAEVQRLTEQRERDDIAGLSNLYATGAANKEESINTAFEGVSSGVGSLAGGGAFDKSASGGVDNIGGDVYAPKAIIEGVNDSSFDNPDDIYNT